MTVQATSRSKAEHLAGVFFLALGYFLLAKVALEPPFIDGDFGRLLWPASGLALAALLTGGLGLWPGVALGAFAATIATSDSLVHSLATSAGNSLEVVLAAALMRGLAGFDNQMERVRDVLALVVFGALMGAAASATLGIFGLYAGNLSPVSVLGRIWWQWTLGHAMGIIVVTPFLLTARSWLKTRSGPNPNRRSEAAVIMTLLVIVGGIAFWNRGPWSEYTLEYLPFPLLIWAAFRCGTPGAALANLVTSGMVVLGTASGSGPFNAGTSTEDLLLTWSFINVTAVTTLLLAAVVSTGHRAQEERQKSESRYRMLIEQASDGIFVADAKGRCTEVNTSGCEMLGYSREEVLTRNLSELVGPEQRRSVEEVLSRLDPGMSSMYSWGMSRQDGSSFPAEVSAKRLDDRRIQAFVRDVSERHALEQQLHQSQKMEAVGLLAGGVAHDFNNLLTAIIGHTDFVRASLREDDKIRRDIEEVGKAASRAAELTRQLLAFARKQIVEPKVVVLERLVLNLENMLRRVVGEHIELKTLLSSEPWAVKVDPVQLEQVILNITINARDAMPGGGKLTLECGSVDWTARDNGPDKEMSPGHYATLVVTDSGAGMDSTTLSRAFEPFFTTKDRSQGTGLGLAVSYGIVKQAGGYIWISSKPGIGTSFEIYLPRADENEIENEEQRHVWTRGKASGGETILLIEDEPLVRDLAVEVLGARSYRVLTACDGEEALAIAREHPSEIHLTVTDVVLPAMSGKEVARRLKGTRPDLKVLFISGYAEEQIVHQGILDDDIAFLAKPFTPAALTDKVRGVLDGR